MDAHLRLKCKASVIGSTSDFAFKWSLNVGLDARDAARLALALDEVITDVVLHAFCEEAHEEGEFEVVFRSNLETAEVVVRELGEPFDPDRHRYDPVRAINEGDFCGAGFELIRHFADDFVFLNKGRAGKEFRIVKRIDAANAVDIIAVSLPRPSPEPADDPPESYTLRTVTPRDAEDISKLIYRTYGHTYANEDMYHPKRIEQGIERGEKYAVITRSQSGEATGYFAILPVPGSTLGEVSEVMVSPRHRCKGLMTRMLGALVEHARAEGLHGLFGEAVAVHEISQRVNHKLGFHSTALMLAAFPITRYRQLVEAYPQDLSAVVDFLLFHPFTPRPVFLPVRYQRMLTGIYRHLGIAVETPDIGARRPARRTQIDVDIAYHNHYAVVVVRRFGRDFRDSVVSTAASLRGRDIHTVYVDLPLDNPFVDDGVETLQSLGYLFSGLMPMMHAGTDYLRMQSVRPGLDLDRIATWSPTAIRIRKRIRNEMRWTTKKQKAGSASA